MMKRSALYPGSFDPVTYGHIDLIERASRIFDRVVVGVANNLHKKPLFDKDERFEMLQEAVKGIVNVEVVAFDGLVVDFARSRGINVLIRGLRMVSDFEYEFQMALVNRKLDEHMITVFLMPHEKYSYLNSSIVKELVRFNGDVSSFVPPHVEENLLQKMRKP